MPTQREHRRAIDIGPRIGQVSSARYWYDAGYFESDNEARGAFRLAYQQGLDGMGTSIADWMGLTEQEYDAWMRDDSLPPRKSRRD